MGDINTKGIFINNLDKIADPLRLFLVTILKSFFFLLW